MIRFTPLPPLALSISDEDSCHCKDTVLFFNPCDYNSFISHRNCGILIVRVALFRFLRSNHILPFQTLIGFIDCDCFLIKVEICRKLTARPLGYRTSKSISKAQKGNRLVHHLKREFLVFFLVQNSILPCVPHVPYFPPLPQDWNAVLIADSVIENGGQLIVQRFQIRL